jgi:succinoglycan biosynthesis protein ExoA
VIETIRIPKPVLPSASLRPWPFISVVVPVRNESRFIRATLQQLLAQDYPCDRFEVIVVDGQSEDGTPSLAATLQRHWSNLRLLHNPRRLSSAARNLGIRAARGEYVVVVDGHCELETDQFLRHLAEAFERSGADCVGRPQPLDVAHASTLQRAIAHARASRLGHHPDSHIYSDAEGFVPPQSVAVAYRRSIFARVGYFDESFDACEDVEFNHRIDRAGLRCFFTPRVRVKYHPRGTLCGLFHQMARYGRGRVRLWRKHPETFTPACFLPALFLLGLVLGPVVGWFAPRLAWAYVAVLASYATVVLAASVGIAVRPRDARLLAWLPLVFPTIHLGAGWGQLQEGWRGRGGAATVPVEPTVVARRVATDTMLAVRPGRTLIPASTRRELESTTLSPRREAA